MEDISRILQDAETIAVVGLSDDPYRTSYGIAETLIALGYEVYPVNPTIDSVFGRRSYPTVTDVPVKVDIVDVFRRQEHLTGVAQDAVRAGARALWLQLGLVSPEAREIATSSGLLYVENRCLGVEAQRFALRSRPVA